MLQSFNSSSTNDCGSCLSKSTTAKYCYNSKTNVEWCCNPSDTSSSCTASDDNVCSPTREKSGDLAYTYCKGAADPTQCGVNSLELMASNTYKTVTRTSFPAYVTVSNQKSYLACYYHIKPEEYKWKDGASIKMSFSKIYDVNV
jgi:hypothetical protein